MAGGPVGDVVFAVGRRGPVGSDVGAQEGEVGAVARPHPVVHVAAELSDAHRLCVDDPQVLEGEGVEEPKASPAIEAAHPDFWRKYVGLHGAVIGIDRFGESAPAGQLLELFGFTVANVVKTAKELLS